MRNFSKIDKSIMKVSKFLETFNIKNSGRPYPASKISNENLTQDEKKLVTNLMRVNHAGEVAAQGLYIGHALAAKSVEQREMMLEMASEEKDHLIWCNERIKELGLDDALIKLKGLTPGMLVTLGEQKILKLEDFADLASDELTGGFDVVKGEKVKIHGYLEDFALSKKEADDLIMSARDIVYQD